MFNLQKYILLPMLILSSCAAFEPEKISMNIELMTVDVDKQPINAVCTLFSSSSKLETLSPNKVAFVTECSPINVVCKTGELRGEYGVMHDINGSKTDGFIINTGIGYIFDAAVDTITPLGALMNFTAFNNSHKECSAPKKITIVLE
tara:strand:+ start:69 stop:509 length:441 start_codon:yes stop_codon:yes gene_type:complete